MRKSKHTQIYSKERQSGFGVKAQFFLAIVFSFVLWFVNERAYSQACCSGGVPLGGSLGLGTAERKSIQFLVTYDFNAINDLMDGSRRLSDDTRSRTTHSSILEINYGLTSRFSIAGVFPLIRQERDINAYAGARDFTATQGLGDVAMLFKIRVLNPEKKSDWEGVVGAGPKFPTGRTTFTNNLGLALPADLQPGSGSWDGLFWSFFQKRNVSHPNLSIMGVATMRITGENKNYNQTQVYQFGNEFQFNLGGNYSAYLQWPLDIFAWFRYRNQAEDFIDGSAFPGSGGQWVYFIPGVNIHFLDNLSFRLSGDIPLYRQLNGTQLTTSYRITLSLSYNLPLHNESLIFN
ncbi:MAG: hypothetical protein K0B09_01255 [Bacteroidales bacterium]|nr:hypothetical protein [Bacteroidales bacterium]